MKKNRKIAAVILPDFCSEIAEIVRSNLIPKKMQEQVGAYHEKDIALALTLLNREEQQRLFRILTIPELAAVLEYAEDKEAYFELLGIRQKAEVLSEMETSEAAEILQPLKKEERESLLELMSPKARERIRLIGSFDEEEIGSRISTNYITILEDATVKEAMSEVIAQAPVNDNLSIPVLDDDNHLIGVVTSQDFVEILGDELGEDYAKLGGLSAEEDLSEPVIQSVKKRMPWLCALLVMGLGVSAAVGMFESIVAKLPVIMCFQSLILDMAGNVGTQSLAVAIRVLMDTQIGPKEKAALVWKEARVGILNGGILGILSFAAIGGYLCVKGNPAVFAFAVSGCLGIAMLLAMIISSMSGTLLPLFFKKVGIDPAVASGPLITTVNDLVAVITYYGLAWVILLNLLKFA